MLRLLVKRLQRRPSAMVAQFHGSTVILGGRWGGEQSLDAQPRDLSRRQKKRKREALAVKTNTVNKSKQKLKDNFVTSQIKTPEFESLLTAQDPALNAAVRRMMLPDDVSIPTLDSSWKRKTPPLPALDVLTELSSGLENAPPSTDGTALVAHVGKKEANTALKTLAAIRDVENTERMLSTMLQNNIPFQHSSLIDVLKMYNKVGKFDKTIDMFDRLDQYAMPHPNPPAWGALIVAKTRNGEGDVEEGLRLLKHLEKSGVVLLADMHNPILRGLIKKGRHTEAYDLWVQMKVKGINPNVESYNIMVEQCEFRGQPERAFFLIDELKLLDLKPSKETFCKLIRACSTAPVWVNGYQDIVSDAMAIMEGQELMPDVEVYNSVLYAYARAGDGAAADFYLQEMKRKKLQPNVKSYNLVFDAYAINQMVGAKYYGKYGRYVRPNPPPDSERQALYKAAGFDIVNDELSKTFIKNDPPERGKRVKMQYEDIAEYNEEMQEALDDSLRVEARARKGRMDEWEAQQQLELEESNEEPLTRISSGPSRKDMMGSLAGRSGNFAEAGGADEGDSLEDMLKDDSVRQLLENDEDFEEMFKRLSSGGNLASNDESLARIMKELGKEDNGEIDPSSFLNEADRKEWENFVGEMEGADNNRKETALDGGLESNDMMSQLSKMMSTAEDDSSAAERVEFQTSQSSVVDTQATVDAFKTLNSLLGFLDDSSGGVSMKEHYVSHNKSITGGELRLDSEGLVATQEIDKLWDLIEFGRPPKPDYSDSLRVRRDKNIDRALEIYDDMITREQIQPNEKTLAGLVGVIGNASLHLRVEKLIEEFKAMHNVIPNDYTYNAIVKMHVIRRDIHSALDAKNKMLELGFRPSRESYGMLINSLAARKMIEEALLTLEETADKGIIIRDVHLRELRRHCTELGIIHPDLPEDPMAWMKAVRQARKNIKNKSKYSVQPIQSGMYN